MKAYIVNQFMNEEQYNDGLKVAHPLIFMNEEKAIKYCRNSVKMNVEEFGAIKQYKRNERRRWVTTFTKDIHPAAVFEIEEAEIVD